MKLTLILATLLFGLNAHAELTKLSRSSEKAILERQCKNPVCREKLCREASSDARKELTDHCDLMSGNIGDEETHFEWKRGGTKGGPYFQCTARIVAICYW